ncbi:MAG: hypothetical protein PHH01_04580 [Patescibacteria group bacterium]|nr:hypothetical protein [Patescibacteria group bacterium]
MRYLKTLLAIAALVLFVAPVIAEGVPAVREGHISFGHGDLAWITVASVREDVAGIGTSYAVHIECIGWELYVTQCRELEKIMCDNRKSPDEMFQSVYGFIEKAGFQASGLDRSGAGSDICYFSGGWVDDETAEALFTAIQGDKEEAYFTVTLLLPYGVEGKMIFVDGEPALVVERTFNIAQIRVPKKSTATRITIGDACEVNVFIERDGKRIFPCQ